MKFVVDGMLGGLARWLRMLGYIVDYDSRTNDDNLLRIADEENMVLLTRDEQLYERAQAKNLSSLLVLGETEGERLGQLARVMGISLVIEMAETRCPECGSRLNEVSKEDVSSVVPAASLKMYSQFWRCTSVECGKVYWVGSHWKQIHHTLEEARRIARLRG